MTHWWSVSFPLCTPSVLRIFVHFHFLSFYSIAQGNFQHYIHFFREIAIFSSKKISFNDFFFLLIFLIFYFFLLEKIIASYGARVRGSVFKMDFRVLAREFESIETSPGFAQLLGENWVKVTKKSIIKTLLAKNCQMTKV